MRLKLSLCDNRPDLSEIISDSRSSPMEGLWMACTRKSARHLNKEGGTGSPTAGGHVTCASAPRLFIAVPSNNVARRASSCGSSVRMAYSCSDCLVEPRRSDRVEEQLLEGGCIR